MTRLSAPPPDPLVRQIGMQCVPAGVAKHYARFRQSLYYGEPFCIDLEGRYFLLLEEAAGYPKAREVSRRFFCAWLNEFAGEGEAA